MKFLTFSALIFSFATAASANDEARVIEVEKEVRTVELTVKNFEFGGRTEFYRNGMEDISPITVVRPQVLVAGKPYFFIHSQGSNFCRFLKKNGFPELDGVRLGNAIGFLNVSQVGIVDLSNEATNPFTSTVSTYLIESITCR